MSSKGWQLRRRSGGSRRYPLLAQPEAPVSEGLGVRGPRGVLARSLVGPRVPGMHVHQKQRLSARRAQGRDGYEKPAPLIRLSGERAVRRLSHPM